MSEVEYFSSAYFCNSKINFFLLVLFPELYNTHFLSVCAISNLIRWFGNFVDETVFYLILVPVLVFVTLRSEV